MSVTVITRTLYLVLLQFFLSPHDQLLFHSFPLDLWDECLNSSLVVILILWLQAILDTVFQIF